MNILTKDEMRDFIIRAHGMATATYMQSDSEMRQRISELLDRAINSDDIMRGFLGREPMASNDAITGTGSLSDAP